MTNVERITHIMDFSKAGPMAQMLVMHSVRTVCENIVADEQKTLAAMENNLIDGAAWIKTARIVLEELEAEDFSR
jgi:hypothetical protein|tara:strand:- start:281 stop:505 length:225 start_codon:yes stop_codon:yes gene_type:complete